MKNIVTFLFIFTTYLSSQEVNVWVSDANDSYVEISITNITGVSGFQFTVIADETLEAQFGDPFGGAAEEAGFMVSSNADGLIIGFSLAGAEIAVGDSIVLSNLNWSIPDDVAGYLNIELIPNSFTGGMPPVALSAEVGESYLFGDNIVFGCTDPDAINYDANATIDDGSCLYPPNPPENLNATGGYNEILLDWNYNDNYRESRDELIVYVSQIEDDGLGNAEIGIHLNNPEADIYGFQFKIYSEVPIILNGAFGGRAEEAGFSVTTNEAGLVLGFSFSGDFISTGEGIFTYLSINYSPDDLGLLSVVGADEDYPDNIFTTIEDDNIFEVAFNWIPINWTVGENFEYEFIDECGDNICTGVEDYFNCPEDCPPPEDITFNIYRDGDLFDTEIETHNYIDSELDFLVNHCYMVTAYNGAYESGFSNEACAITAPLGADIAITPEFLSENLFTGESNDQSLTISNSGDDDLIWNTNIEEVDGDLNRFEYNFEEIKKDIRIQPEGEIVPGELIVRYHSTTSVYQREIITRLLTITREKHYNELNLYLYKYESDWSIENIIHYMNKFEKVLYAEPSYRVQAVQTIPNDPFFNEQWGMHNIGQDGGVEDTDLNGPEAWDVETGNNDIVVGIIDTGIDYYHPDLIDNIWTNSGEIPDNGIDDDNNGYIDDFYGYNFSEYTSDPWDDNGHGTHCAGVVSGIGNNGVGITGVNWNAKVAAIKFLSSGGGGSTEGAIEATLYANMMDIHMTSNSWGGGPYSEGLKDAIEFGDKLFIAAAGNFGGNNDANPFYPATYDSENIISVAAINRYDQLVDEGWWGSNYGLNTVDIAAAGLDVFSTFPIGAYLSDDCMDGNGDGYGICSGTSMATPHVAGVAALTLGRDSNMDWFTNKQIIMESSTPTPGLNGYCVTGGRVNAYQAVIMVQPQWVEVIPENGVLPPGETMNVSVNFNSEGLYGGEYLANILFESNDPDEPVVVVGTELNVTGAPNLSLDQDYLSFGEVFVNGNSTLEIMITNNGTDLLEIYELISDNPSFTLNTDFIQLEPEENHILLVTFSPNEQGVETGQLSLTSNDPGDPVIIVTVTGTALMPPDISVNPTSYTADLFTGDSLIEIMTINNSGVAELEFEINIEEDDAFSIFRSNIPFTQNMNTTLVREYPTNQTNNNAIDNNRDNVNAQVMTIGSIPENILLYADDYYMSPGEHYIDIALQEMELSYTGVYGDPYEFSSLLMSDEWDMVILDNWNNYPDPAWWNLLEEYIINGGICLISTFEIDGSSGESLWETVGIELYSDLNIPEDIYWWDDTHPIFNTPNDVPGFVFMLDDYIDDGDKVNPNDNGTAIAGFTPEETENQASIILSNNYPVIVNSFAVVENRNDSDSDGIIDAIELYMNELNYLIYNTGEWLSVNVETGIVPAGESVDVEVKFDATGLYGGEYNADIVVSSNDPDESLINLPATLFVTGAPNISIDQNSLDFGEVFIDGNQTIILHILNNGTDNLEIFNIETDNDLFTLSVNSGIILPEEILQLGVNFAPALPMDELGILTIISNDPGSPELEVSLLGTGIMPPDIMVTPNSFAEDMYTGDIVTEILSVSNTGSADLLVDIGIEIIEEEIREYSNTQEENIILRNITVNDVNNDNPNNDGSFTLREEYSGDYLTFGISDYGEIMPLQFLGNEFLAIGSWVSGYTVGYIDITGDIWVYYTGWDVWDGIIPVSYTEIVNNDNEVIVEVITQTEGGEIVIVRTFTFERSEKYVQIHTSLINQSEAILQGVIFKSFADWDIDNDYEDDSFDYDLERNMVYAWDINYGGITSEEIPAHMDLDGWGDYGSYNTVIDYPEGPITFFDGFGISHFEVGDLDVNDEWEITNAFVTGESLDVLHETADNALNYISTDWIIADPEYLTIPSGFTAEVIVTFNAEGLYGGNYNANIILENNDPDESLVVIPAFMTVTGAPNLFVDPMNLEFGDVFVDGSSTLVVNLENNGTDILNISSITSDNNNFIIDLNSMELEPEDDYDLQVIFAPTFEGDQIASILLTSNDPSNPEVVVTLSGTGLLPPDIEITPESFSTSLFTGDTLTEIMTIFNDGVANLDFIIDIIEIDDVLRNYNNNIEILSIENIVNRNINNHSYSNYYNSKMNHSYQQIENDLSDDLYTTRNNRDENLIAVLCDFAYPGIEELENTLLDLGYEYVSVSSVSEAEDAGAQAIIAGYGSGCDASDVSAWIESGKGFIQNGDWFNWFPNSWSETGSSPIEIQLLDVEHPLADNLPNTWQANGFWHYAGWGYLGWVTDEIFSNVASGDGIDRVVTADQIGEGFAVYLGINVFGPEAGDESIQLFSNALDFVTGSTNTDWLTINPEIGFIESNDSIEIAVHFNATGLFGGEYNADIIISSNDPNESELIVPASLFVTGAPNLSINPINLNFGDVFVDGSSTMTVNVANNGTDDLSITSMESDNDDFTTDITSLVLSPEEEYDLQVTFLPSFDGDQVGTISLLSNDPSNPEVIITLSGTGQLPPDINVDPLSVTASLFTGDIDSSQSLLISNSGYSQLDYDIEIVFEEDDQAFLVNDELIYNKNIIGSLGNSINNNSIIQSNNTIYKGTRIIPNIQRDNRDLPYVLIMHTYDLPLTWANDLEASAIDFWDSDAPLDILLMYDVVIVGSNFSWNDPIEMGDNLAQYVDEGGAVILLGATFHTGGSWALSGMINTSEYNPLLPSTYSCCADTQWINEPSDHPIMNDVDELWTNLWAYTETQGNGISLGTFSSGNDLGAYNPDKNVIALNVFANGSVDNEWFGGSFIQLMNNSIGWISGNISQWISVNPEEGMIEDGDANDITLTFDATGLYGGEYTADIIISSNDPDENDVIVPATLFVTGAPNLTVEPTNLDYGEIFVDGNLTLYVTLANNGTDILNISEISSNNSDFIINVNSLGIEPEDLYELEVIFAPTFAGDQTGEIIILSNDPSNPIATINLTGTGILPPVILVNPEEMSASLYTGEVEDQILNISNTGFSDLEFLTEIEFFDGSFSNNRNTSIIKPSSIKELASIKGQIERNRLEINTSFNNDINRSMPIFNHSDDDIILDRDGDLLGEGEFLFSFPDYSGNASPMGIAFDGTYYYVVGGGYSTGEVAQLDSEFNLVSTQEVALDCRGVLYNPNDGFIYITGYTDSGLFKLNTEPFDGSYETVYNGITQYYQSNLVISNDGQLLYDQYFGNINVYDFETGILVDNYILSPFYSDYHPAAYQLAHTGDYLLAISGSYLYGYDPFTGELIGQCEIGFTGYEYSISYANGMFMMTNVSETDWHAYLIDDGSNQLNSWLSVAPEDGVIQENESLDIIVHFDAAGLYGGDYHANINIINNDPTNQIATIPVVLTVTGAPNLSLDVVNIEFGDVFIDGSSLMEFTIINDGTDQLVVNDIYTTEEVFTVNISGFTLNPEESQIVDVTFAPTVEGLQEGQIIITSNDPGSPEMEIDISGFGLLPPDIVTSPDLFSVELYTGDVDSSQSITITNTGYSVLEYYINTETDGLSSPSFTQNMSYNNEDLRGRNVRVSWNGNLNIDNIQTKEHLNWLMRELPDSNVIFYDNMEDGINGWTTEVYTVDDIWHHTDINFNSPTNSWWCADEATGTYSTGYHISTAAISPVIDLTELDSTITLQFYENYETEGGWDFCMVDISIDGGVSWEPLRGGPGEAPSGSSFGWISSMLDITSYGGNEIQLRFYFDTGDDVLNEYPGWFFDDVVIYTDQIPWLDVSQTEGSIDPGDSDEITVYFDAEGLFGGLYSGEVQIHSNDPDESLIIIPAELQVTGAPGIGIDPSIMYFDSTIVGDVVSIPFTVHNTGTDLLVVTNIFCDNELFTPSITNFTIDVGNNQVVDLSFAPETSGLQLGTIVIENNDPSNPEVFISVSGLGIVEGCMDPDAVNFNPEANIDDGSCIYRPNAPEELIALAGEENILLDWDYDISETDYPVKVYVSEIIDNGDGNVTLGLNMVNEVGISGWQFMLEPAVDLTITNAYGGRASEANHLISFNEDGLILGFSMDLTLVEAGQGVLVYIDAEYNLDDIGFLADLSHIYEDIFGNRLTVFVDEEGFEVPYEWVVTHWEVGSDLLITSDINFNIYRNEMILVEGITETEYNDLDIIFGLEYCYTIKAFDGAYESDPSNISCAMVEVSEVTQNINIQAFTMNMISSNVTPIINDLPDLMEYNDILFMANDEGGFFVPSFGINSIGDWSIEDGYRVFLSSSEDQIFNLTGEPTQEDMTLIIEAFTMNMIPYIKQEPMTSSAAFGSYNDNILLVKDDSGNFYVPSFGIYSLETLEPGEAYSIFLSSSEDILFNYSEDGGFSRDIEQSVWMINTHLTQLDHYNITVTGISYPVILESISGSIESGDELAVYTNNIPVGAVKILSKDKPVVIPIWEGFHEFGIDLPGFIHGDELSLRLWSQSKNKELLVEVDLSNNIVGSEPMISGNAIVYNLPAVPEKYTIEQPYPNPFNAATRIDFALPNKSNVQIRIYDMLGKEIELLLNDNMDSGYHSIIWNAENYSSGLYLVQFVSNGKQKIQKLLLIK